MRAVLFQNLIVTAGGASQVRTKNHSGETLDNYVIPRRYTLASSVSTCSVYIPVSWFSARVTYRVVGALHVLMRGSDL